MIAHFDLDSFFASVELLTAPQLKGKPVIVGGMSDRSIVTTCTYEARKFGVHSAMPMKVAMRLCPQAIVLPGNYAAYKRYSKMITDIIAEKAPLFEKASIDEFYIDLQGLDTYFHPLQWTIDLRQYIIDKTGLPLSFGIGRNKMIAKMATNEAKPNGYLQIPIGKEKEFLAPLSVDKIPGVGKQLSEILHYFKLNIIGDIHSASHDFLIKIAGNRGADLWDKVQGENLSILDPNPQSKSISKETTYEQDVNDSAFLHAEIIRMVEHVSMKLRSEEKTTNCVAIKLRYPDFETITRQMSIEPTCSDDEILPAAKELLNKVYLKNKAVRLLGVRVSGLHHFSVQSSLFRSMEESKALYKAIDEVRSRFGKEFIFRAGAQHKK